MALSISKESSLNSKMDSLKVSIEARSVESLLSSSIAIIVITLLAVRRKIISIVNHV